MTIRPELPADVEAIRTVNEQAFGRPDEARLVDALRDAGCPCVSLVAESAGEVVGHILFTPVRLEPEVARIRGLGLAPMAVLPVHQRQGIGSALVRAGLNACRQFGTDFVVVLGHPDYYPRFGFVPAHARGLRCEFPAPEESFLLLDLRSGSVPFGEAIIRYRPEFREL